MYYSALGSSATGAVSSAGAASAFGAAFLERRVRVVFLAVFAIASSKSTSSMKARSASSEGRLPNLDGQQPLMLPRQKAQRWHTCSEDS